MKVVYPFSLDFGNVINFNASTSSALPMIQLMGPLEGAVGSTASPVAQPVEEQTIDRPFCPR